MREIKFRAWLPGINKMTYTHSLEELMGWNIKEWTHGTAEWMQYTEYKDKNGKEMYDKDICKFVILKEEEKYNPIEALLVIIEWKRGAWGFRPLYPELVHEDVRGWTPFVRDENDDWNTNYFEIIGNIHENKELIQ